MVISACLSISGVAAQSDPLDDIALKTSELDLSVVALLLQLKQEQYPYATSPWQMRWHLLRCEQASLVNDINTMEQQLQELKAFSRTSVDATSIIALCQSNLHAANNEFAAQQQLTFQLINNTKSWNDPQLKAALLMKLALNQPLDQGPLVIVDNLSEALVISQKSPPSPWIGVPQAMMHYGIARAFDSPNNFPKAQHAVEQALLNVRPDSVLQWFIQFNYAVMLEHQGLLQRAHQQLQQLSTHLPDEQIINHGKIADFRASVAYQVEDYPAAINHANTAIAIYTAAAQPYQVDLALIMLGKAKIQSGDQSGWEHINIAKRLLKQDYRLEPVAAVERWSAGYHLAAEEFIKAYQSLAQYTDLQKIINADQQKQVLLEQQQLLNEQLDGHRQRLAATAEAHYRGQQSLLRWQGYALGLTMLVIIVAVWRAANRIGHKVEQNQTPEAKLTVAIQQAKDESDPLPMLLLRLTNVAASSERIRLQLTQDLRPQDHCLQLNELDYLLMFPFASDGELQWRHERIALQLEAISIRAYQVAQGRLNQFDDEKSIMLRLEYELTSSHARSRTQPLSI
ncbi:hypothetical protein [Ferrimonas lipolytica]|nr:hypothetical protein [Ferrimonas lipolytica]